MKYFTADLLYRFGSEDAASAGAAQEEWDEACQRYNAYLDTLKEELPPGLRHIEEHYNLHDAKVRGMGRQGPSFVLMLQLDTPPHSLLTFTFELVGEPVINPTALPCELRSTGDVTDWQYVELDRSAGEPPTWFWSILFSNGWEVRLPFRDVAVQEVQALIPAPPHENSRDRIPNFGSMTPSTA
jgi:hypothetical protein